MNGNNAALRDARNAVLTAPDRQTAIEAYRYWYGLKNGTIPVIDCIGSEEQPSWLNKLIEGYR